jgi:hypothetical protein
VSTEECAFCQHPFAADRRRRPLVGIALLLLGAALLVVALMFVLWRPLILTTP